MNEAFVAKLNMNNLQSSLLLADLLIPHFAALHSALKIPRVIAWSQKYDVQAWTRFHSLLV